MTLSISHMTFSISHMTFLNKERHGGNSLPPNWFEGIFLKPTTLQLNRPFTCVLSHMTFLMSHVTFLNNTCR
jgi:hypothetical protein